MYVDLTTARHDVLSEHYDLTRLDRHHLHCAGLAEQGVWLSPRLCLGFQREQ
jgi:hypothetical protein